MGNYDNILDFSDLGKPFQFRYGNYIYQIDPIPPRVAQELIEKARKISAKAREIEDKIKELEEKKLEVPEELHKEMGTAFDYQIDFILKAGIRKINQEDNSLIIVNENELKDEWPTKLVNRVFNHTNKLLQLDEEDIQEKKF